MEFHMLSPSDRNSARWVQFSILFSILRRCGGAWAVDMEGPEIMMWAGVRVELWGIAPVLRIRAD